MQATQLRGPFINGFTTDTPEGKPAKKIKSWFLNARFMDNRAVSGANFRNRINLSSDRTKSSFSQKTSNHRHVFHLVSCQSSSDCHVGPFNKEERLVPKNGSLVNNLKEGICDLMGIPLNQPRSGGVVSDLIILALPAIFGQAIEPLSQLMETAYIGSLGPVELASAGVSVSIFNIISKLFNIPLLSVTTSFVAEDISRSTCGESVSSSNFLEQNKKINMPSIEVEERKQLPSVSTALLLAAGIGILEAGALYYGAGSFLNLMGVSSGRTVL